MLFLLFFSLRAVYFPAVAFSPIETPHVSCDFVMPLEGRDGDWVVSLSDMIFDLAVWVICFHHTNRAVIFATLGGALQASLASAETPGSLRLH